MLGDGSDSRSSELGVFVLLEVTDGQQLGVEAGANRSVDTLDFNILRILRSRQAKVVRPRPVFAGKKGRGRVVTSTGLASPPSPSFPLPRSGGEGGYVVAAPLR